MIKRYHTRELDAGGNKTGLGDDELEIVRTGGKAGKLAGDLKPVFILDGLPEDRRIELQVSSLAGAARICSINAVPVELA